MTDAYRPQAWRMAGYYPGQYARSVSALGIGIDYSDDDHAQYEAEFLADLAAHDAEVKAHALEDAATVIPEQMRMDELGLHQLNYTDELPQLSKVMLNGATRFAERLVERADEIREAR